MLKSESNYYYNLENSYERFMKKHLQHYGYYKGNKSILRELEGYEKTQSDESTSESENAVKCNQKTGTSPSLRTTQLIYDYFEDGSYIRKLKPPHTYVLNLQQAPRWPIEMQVLPERIQHISALPQQREFIYIQSNSELKPQPRGEENGRLIFEYKTFSGPYFTKSKTISKEIGNLPPVTGDSESESDETLSFESRFESGNLEKVYKISPFEYELYLRPDMYTSKHTQWYYFRVSNTRANKMYRFTIVNFYKAESLYNEGLKPLLYSEKDAQLSNKGWRRWGHNIAYYRNNLKYETKKGENYYYSLTWNCLFPHDNDTVYFSHCYPYTYSNLMKYVETVSKDPVKSKICRIKLLTKSLAENISLLLTITNSFSEQERKNYKKIIFITGRVHPGESNASWMMEGVLDFLLSDKPDAMLLRDLFIFKIVPMLNPDGVIVGNYRCSLTGRDLNRNYKSQLRDYYPIIWSVKNLVDKILKDHEILFYCDFHGHSRKNNIFMYGCNDQKSENEFLIERAFPYILAKNASDKFDYKSCKFKMQKSKSGTSRIVFRNFGIPHSFTLEASFCGTDLIANTNNNRNEQFYHFNTEDLKKMGEAFCHSLLDFCDPDQTQMNIILGNIKEDLKKRYTNKLTTRGINIDENKILSISVLDLDLDDGSSGDDDGSDSSDSNGLPTYCEYVEENKVKKVKRRENKEKKIAPKELMENKSVLGARCLTCLHINHNNITPIKTPIESKPKSVHFSETSKKKLKSPSPKTDRTLSMEEKEKGLILPRCYTNNLVFKRFSPNLLEEPIKLTYQEIEASKIQLSYSGVSRYKSENYMDSLCPLHISESLKDKERRSRQNSNYIFRKPSTNLNEQDLSTKQYSRKNVIRPTSGLQKTTFQILSFNNMLAEPNNKPRLDHHKSFNPVKRLQSITVSKKNSKQSENSKQTEKSLSISNIMENF